MNQDQTINQDQITWLQMPMIDVKDKLLAFVMKSFSEVAENKHAAAGVPFFNQDNAIFALNQDGEILGCVIYRYVQLERLFWVVMTAVNPKFRGNRLHQTMNKYLDAIARSMSIKEVASHVAVTNEACLRAHEIYGSSKRFYRVSREP